MWSAYLLRWIYTVYPFLPVFFCFFFTFLHLHETLCAVLYAFLQADIRTLSRLLRYDKNLIKNFV